MGGSASRAVDAEAKLLTWGVHWWEKWKIAAPQGPHLLGLDEMKGVSRADVSGGLERRAFDVHIGNEEFLHTVKYSHAKQREGKKSPLVMLHGYGCGLGIYYTALPILAECYAGDVYALDQKGCGLSSRPKWSLGVGEKSNVVETEAYFVDALEAWRQSMKLDKMVLMGHSMGGYLASCYAERFPQYLDGLVLVSPVGLPEAPSDYKASFEKAGMLWKSIYGLWERGWGPMHMPGKSYLLDRYVRARFTAHSWNSAELLKDYLYTNWMHGDTSGGGVAHSTLLMPGAFARSPLHRRLPHLRVPNILFVYGEEDWMDYRHALAVRDDILRLSKPGPDVRCVRIEGGGHNMMTDNPVGFVEGFMHVCDPSSTDMNHKLGAWAVYQDSEYVAKNNVEAAPAVDIPTDGVPSLASESGAPK